MDHDPSLPNGETVQFVLGRLDGKVDILLSQVRGYDTRLRAVEKRQWWATGAAAVAGAALSKYFPIASLFH